MPDTVTENEARGSRRLSPHGTVAAVRRHHRHHEPLCEPCVVASHADRAKRYKDDYAKSKTAVETARRTAKARAYRILADRHFIEWVDLLDDTIAEELESKGLST